VKLGEFQKKTVSVMKKLLLLVTLLFTLFIVTIVIRADAGQFPPLLKRFYDFPGGDKVGHFILFGILSFLLNKSALTLLFPNWNPARLVLTVSLLLAILIGLEEWSQALFPTRTMSFTDLFASYAGLIIFAVLALWSKR
jgi:VanZ family protein